MSRRFLCKVRGAGGGRARLGLGLLGLLGLRLGSSPQGLSERTQKTPKKRAKYGPDLRPPAGAREAKFKSLMSQGASALNRTSSTSMILPETV